MNGRNVIHDVITFNHKEFMPQYANMQFLRLQVSQCTSFSFLKCFCDVENVHVQFCMPTKPKQGYFTSSNEVLLSCLMTVCVLVSRIS